MVTAFRRAMEIALRHPAVPALLVAAITFALRLPFLDWPLISDEGGYAYTAEQWFRGVALYSSDLWFDRPQAIFLAYKLGLRLIGPETSDIRLWGALWAAVTGAFVYAAALSLDGRRTALAAGLVYAAFSAMPQIEGFTANSEVFSLLPGTIAVWCLINRRWGAAGFFAVASFLLKPSGGSIILLAIYLLHRHRGGWRGWLAFAGLGAVPAIASFAHGAWTVGAGAYLHAVAGHRLSMPSNASLALFLEGWTSTVAAWLPLAAIWLFGLRLQTSDQRRLVAAWLASAVIGMAAGGRWNLHYFIQIVPPLSVAAALTLVRVLPPGGLLLRGAAALALAIPLVLGGRYAIVSPRVGSWFLYGRQGYQIAEPVAAYIRQHTRPEDSIYVAFWEADIYYLAQRRAVIPAIYRLDLIHTEGMYDRLIDAVDRRVPAYILMLDPPPLEVDRGMRFLRAARQGYHVERTFMGSSLLARNREP